MLFRSLVYMLISIILVSKFPYEFEYSIPAYIGGIAMLFSFFQHMSIKKPDYGKMNTIELQKAISQFRIHTSKYSKYDVSIVCLWVLTLQPILFKYIFKIDSFFPYLLLYFIFLLWILFTLVRSKHVYEKQDKQLKELEEQLNQIMEFEKNNVCQ